MDAEDFPMLPACRHNREEHSARRRAEFGHERLFTCAAVIIAGSIILRTG